MEELIASIDMIIKLTSEEAGQIESAFDRHSIPAGGYLIEEGQYCDHIAFLTKGRLRVYYHDGDANEVTCYFADPGQFISSYTSYLTRTPTREYIEAIEETDTYIIDRETMEILSEKIPKLQVFRRVIAENLYLMMERRITMLQVYSARERYEKFMEENPDLLLNVPLQYTASFLGITPQHLSRLRKKLVD